MDIPLDTLEYAFTQKPILVGGKAMEYYGLRASGRDIDLVAAHDDIARLIKLYPGRLKDLSGDLGVCPFEFEIWRTINYFDYAFFRADALEKEHFFIVSPEKLLFSKALAIEKEKYLSDVKLIAGYVIRDQSRQSKRINAENGELLKNVEGIAYLERHADA
jgi:hypothetical protein